MVSLQVPILVFLLQIIELLIAIKVLSAMIKFVKTPEMQGLECFILVMVDFSHIFISTNKQKYFNLSFNIKKDDLIVL